MKKTVAILAASAALSAGAVALPTAAQAATIQGQAVRYTFCSDNQFGNDLTYYDSYGLVELRNVTLPRNVGGARFCGTVETSQESGTYLWSHIRNYNSPYVYAAIDDVYFPPFAGSTGEPPSYRLIARSQDYSNYGYASAMAM